MKQNLRVVWSAMVMAIAASFASVSAASYYVDPAGSDANDGTSTSSAWKTLAKVTGTTFVAGDRIYLKRACSWTGVLNPKGSGASGNPIIIDAYGTGNRPIIDGNGTLDVGAVYVKNQQYIEFSNLEIINNAATAGLRRGFGAEMTNGGIFNHIYIKNCYIHNVKGNTSGGRDYGGIVFYNNGSTTGRFNDILIENNTIKTCDFIGIRTPSQWRNRGGERSGRGPWNGNTNVVIRSNTLEDIGADGIVPGHSNGPLVEYNRVIANGRLTGTISCPIWPWNCDNFIGQYNEVYNTLNNGDGEAYDADWNCNNTIFQYNYSHDNIKGAFMVTVNGGIRGAFCNGTIIRYNISINDGKVVALYGPLGTTNIYNNTFYATSSRPHSSIQTWGGTPAGGKVFFKNNIFYNTGHWLSFASSNMTYENNVFYCGDGKHTGEPSDAHKLTSNPMFASPSSTSPVDVDMTSSTRLSGWKLRSGSPCINSGVLISSNGGKDFWGNAVSSSSAPNRGAHQGSVAGGGSAPTVATAATAANAIPLWNDVAVILGKRSVFAQDDDYPVFSINGRRGFSISRAGALGNYRAAPGTYIVRNIDK